MLALRYSKIFFSLAFLLILYLFYRMIRPFLISVILSLTLVTFLEIYKIEFREQLMPVPRMQ